MTITLDKVYTKLINCKKLRVKKLCRRQGFRTPKHIKLNKVITIYWKEKLNDNEKVITFLE
jgi:hypothetical protein